MIPPGLQTGILRSRHAFASHRADRDRDLHGARPRGRRDPEEPALASAL